MFSKQFVKATEDYCTYDKPVNAPYLRKKIILKEKVEKATLTMTAIGFYRVFVNGKEITWSKLAPGITNPDQIIFYDTYDIAAYLQPGENVLGFLLGNGIADCMGGFIWEFDKALFRTAPKLAFALEMGEGEQKICIEADESVLTAPSPIYFDDLRSGEFYDARLEIPGWNLPGFDDSTWKPALKTDPARGDYALNNTDPVRFISEEKAVSVRKAKVSFSPSTNFRKEIFELSKTAFYQPEEHEEGILYAFEDNRSCLPKLKIQGKPGQKIIIQAAEFATEDTVDFSNINRFYPFGFCQRDIYICKGGEEEYIPSFTYHGARYFLVIGLEEDQIRPDTVTQLILNSDIPQIGGFSCSDETANLLQHAACNSVYANFVFFPTDCPHREKNGWTGDASMSAEYMLQNFRPEKSLKQWLEQIIRTQTLEGMLPGIVPTSGWGYEWGNGPTWDQVILELPYRIYQYRGDLSAFEITKDAVIRYLNYASNRRDAHGLLHIGLGDWCNVGRGSDNPLCPLEVSDTAVTYNFAKKAAFLFEKLGKHAQALFAEAFAAELRADFRKYLMDPCTMTVYGNCQAAQAIGLYYGLFDVAEEGRAFEKLVQLVHEEDDHFNCGMIGVRVLFRTLAKYGEAELAYKMITRTDFPSYGMFVNTYGLSSVPETFQNSVDGFTTSLNHHFMADYSGFFIAHIAGLQVNPFMEDPNCLRIAPNFIEKLTHAEATYETEKGKVSVRWERKDTCIDLIVDMPEGVYGDVVLPAGYRFCQMEKKKDGQRILTLNAGTYHIIG